MCTITYLPLSTGSFILTQNRDESPLRSPAVFPVKEERRGRELLFPQDPQAGGSWMATDSQNRLLCLMNGGLGYHQPKPPYRRSRGQILLDAATDSFYSFAANYDLTGIEPFSLLFFERNGKTFTISELRWSGALKYIRTLDASRSHIWSAPQLYSGQQQQEREKWFRHWLDTTSSLSSEAVLNFHLHDGKEQPGHSLLLRREQVKTVSITQVKAGEAGIEMKYIPLTNEPLKESLNET